MSTLVERRTEPWILAAGGLVWQAPEGTAPALIAALELGFGLELELRPGPAGETLVCGRDRDAERWPAHDSSAWCHPAVASWPPLPLAEALTLARVHSRWRAPLLLRLRSRSCDFVAAVARTVLDEGSEQRVRLCGLATRPDDDLRDAADGLRWLVDARSPAEVPPFAEPQPAGYRLHFVPAAAFVAAMRAHRLEVWIAPDLALTRGNCERLLAAPLHGVATRYPADLRQAWQRAAAAVWR